MHNEKENFHFDLMSMLSSGQVACPRIDNDNKTDSQILTESGQWRTNSGLNALQHDFLGLNLYWWII